MKNERRVLLVALTLALVCTSCGHPPRSDDSNDAGGDADGGNIDEADRDDRDCDRPCGDLCCEVGEACISDVCIDDISCAGGETCLNDTFCHDGLCVPFGPPFSDYDESCVREVEPLESFEPDIQCEWPGDFEIEYPSATSAIMSPVVGDLDRDGVPEIVFTTTVVGTWTSPVLRVIRGDTCAPVWSSNTYVRSLESVALADVTGDGLLEICSRGVGGVPFCMSGDGALLWEGHDGDGARRVVDSSSVMTSISVANVDGEESPEVIIGHTVFDGPTGLLLGGVGSPIGGGSYYNWGHVMALADVDLDGHHEALTGGWIVDLVTFETSSWGTTEGHTAVAELSNEYEGPEVVVVSPLGGQIRVQALDGTVIYQHAVPGGAGGQPTIADLDGDGQAEIAASGNYFFTTYDLDCAGIRDGVCPENGSPDGVLWSLSSAEGSSGVTGSVVFDFEGDGPVEVVYADECWARVYDGATGAVKFSTPHSSGTGHEYPVVADVDGDFFTELVIPHNPWSGSAGCPSTDPHMESVAREAGRLYEGITVYRDRQDRWAPSRPLWSQHTEHFYQRNDDGSVPVVELPSWESGRYNSYRQAHPPQGVEAYFIPDLTVGRIDAPSCDSAAREQILGASVCNRGTLPVATGVQVSFRLDEPGGEELCSASTTDVLHSGECENVQCTWTEVPLEERHVIIAVVDPDDGEIIIECREDNNTASDEVRCPPALE